MVQFITFIVVIASFNFAFCDEISDINCDAPIIEAKEGEGIDGQYIVVFQDDVTDDEANEIVKSIEGSGGNRRHQWHKGNSTEKGFSGCAIKVNQQKRAGVLRKAKRNCKVKYIEQDKRAHVKESCTNQASSGWCLASIPREIPSNRYIHPSSQGAGAVIYVIDTGCNPNHPDLRGRVTLRRNFVSTETDDDRNGHGTATASAAGGRTYGAAKRSSLVCVKALNAQGSGAYSDIISAVNWCASRADKGIINLSLGGPRSPALNDAINNAFARGHLPVVAAGNENQDANNVSPASATRAFTVAAHDKNYNLASFSNWGSAVDLIAPGVNCLCADLRSNGAKEISGTSFSSPYTAGVAAIIQAQYRWLNDNNAPTNIGNMLRNQAKRDMRNNRGGTTDRVLQWKNCA